VRCSLIAFAEERLGGIDVLINNAGLGTSRNASST
jgi:NAD(P)-dependent dehydrogenase (short-subunit alcohol dehydrogenase family)